jgi:hypothetical protein
MRAAKFQLVTIKMGAVTAEAAGSSPVVPAIFSTTPAVPLTFFMRCGSADDAQYLILIAVLTIFGAIDN